MDVEDGIQFAAVDGRRSSQRAGTAILADANQSPLHLRARHKKGVNVMYGSGGAKWVSKDAFVPSGQPPVGTYAAITLPPSDGASATINVPSPGVHTVNVWMREDGFRLDRTARIVEQSRDAFA